MNMEEFFRNYQYTLSALGVLGTFAAVVVALVIAYKEPKPSVEATLQIKCHGDYFGGSSTQDFYFIIASVLNTGSHILEIHEHSFRSNEDIKYPLDAIQIDYTDTPQSYEEIAYYYYNEKGETKCYSPLTEKMKNYPVCIQPRRSERFYLWVVNNDGTIYENPDLSNLNLILDNKYFFKIKNSRQFQQELKELTTKLKKEFEGRKIKEVIT